MSATHCASCGKPWTDHLGIAGTCADLMRMRRALEVIASGDPVRCRTAQSVSTNHGHREAIDIARDALGWKRWPSAPGTPK